MLRRKEQKNTLTIMEPGIQQQPPLNQAFFSSKLIPHFCTRREQTVWSRIQIGHTNISHVHLMKKEPRPLCEFCNLSLISINHLILECPHLTEKKKIFRVPTSLEDITAIKNFNL
ncbi:RNase H domain-containing protein [Aphis craccivora]|uniref:RNase H domain-containing protein n=1 Tax=Aphis craccivora TaxID=307492 RepID=A0A6G0Z7H0_APHCR|nr:RNase H domain-containing protein [Aphis craccivora]